MITGLRFPAIATGSKESAMNLVRQILIVEDDPNLRETLAEQLRLHEEFAIGEAGSGGEAIERVKS